MMKIGYDAKRYYHNNTGLGNYSRTLVKNLQEMFPENEYRLYDEKAFQRTFSMAKKAEREGCQLFHGLSNELPMVLPKGSMKTVVTMHDIAWITFPDMYHWHDRIIYDIKYGRSCRTADHVIAISQSTKRDVMKYYGVPEEKISVVYQPVQDFYYTPMSAGKAEGLISSHFGNTLPKEFILYVGSINSRKNLLVVVRALQVMPPERRPFLLIIGNGREYRREVESYIMRHALDRHTLIETNIHNNQLLQALYKMAKVFVYPSFYEGFGLPVVEAALQQTAVITTTVSSLPEAAGRDACLIDPHSDDAHLQISHFLDRLLSDDDYRTMVGKRMEEYSRRSFAPDALTRQMMDTYLTICQK